MQEHGVIPKALQKGDTIAFVSPSSRVNRLFPGRVPRATAYFESCGFRVKEIFTPQLSSDFLTSIHQRCEELHDAFRDPQIKAIICTTGGLSANELLAHLDYDLIAANPKIFIGHSDITLLHNALFVKTGLRTFYGPSVIKQFGEYPSPVKFTADHLFQTLSLPSSALNSATGQQQSIPRSQTYVREWVDWFSEESNSRARKTEPSPPWKWLREGKASGRLGGGCLPSIVQLCGTEYLPDFSGQILVIETPEGMGPPDSPFAPEYARMAVADLRNSGVLQKLAGMVVGRPFQYDEEMRLQFEKMVVEQCYGTDFPILANLDTGHTDPILTLPLGCLVSLDSEKDEFVLEEAAVR